MDKFSKEKRSDIMSHVRGKNTKPEEAIRKYLFSKGFRYRKMIRDIWETGHCAPEVSYGNFCKRLFLASASGVQICCIAGNEP